MQKLISLQEKYLSDSSYFEPLLLEYEKLICKNSELAIKLNLVDKLFLMWKQQLQNTDSSKRILISAIGSFNLMSLVYIHELPSNTSTFHVIQLEHCICLKRSSKALPNRQIHAILLNKIYSALSDVHRYYNKQFNEDLDTESNYSLSALHYFYFDGKSLNQLGIFYQFESIKRPMEKLQNGIKCFYYYLFAILTPYPFKKAEENLQHFIKVFLGLIVIDVHPYSKLLYVLFKLYAKQEVEIEDIDFLLLDSLTPDMQNLIFKCCVGLFHLETGPVIYMAILKLFVKFHSSNQITINYLNFTISYISDIREFLTQPDIRRLFDDTVKILKSKNVKRTGVFITVYDFDLTHLKKIGQFIGELAIKFADEQGITDDQDGPQIAVDQALVSCSERIGYFMELVIAEVGTQAYSTPESKFEMAKSNLKAKSNTAVILTDKYITMNLVASIEKWVKSKSIILIVPWFMLELVLKSSKNKKNSEIYSSLHEIILDQEQDSLSTLIVQSKQLEFSIEDCFKYFNKMASGCALFVLGSSKDYPTIPTIDTFALEQLVNK